MRLIIIILSKTTTMKIVKNNYIFFIFLLPLAIYFYFGFQHIGKFETADESLWISSDTSVAQDRIHSYWNAIATKNWLGTRINDKPGITLAYISGIGMLFEKQPIGTTQHSTDYYRQTDTARYEATMPFFRLPILIFNGLMSFLFFYFIAKLTKSRWIGLTAATLILLSPILTGISQIINPDSLLFPFAFATFLSFVLFLQTRITKYVILTSTFLGFSLLSKYTADIFFLFFFVLAFLYLFLYYENWTDRDQLKSYVKKVFFGIPLIIGGSLLIFALLLPASFIQPIFLFEKTIFMKGMEKYLLIMISMGCLFILDAYFNQSKYTEKIISALRPYKNYILNLIYLLLGFVFLVSLLNWSVFNNILHIKELAFDLARDYSFQRQHFIDKLFLELLPLTFTLSPVVLFAILAIWIRSIFKKSKHDFSVLAVSLFIIMFYAAMVEMKLLTHVRYEIMLYPLTAFLAAIGIWEATSFINFKVKSFNPKIWTFILVLLLGVADLIYIYPFYFNYTSFLLPKRKNIVGSWGYGGYEAAQYLNNLPNAKELLVWSDYDGFCDFFVGKCMEKKDWNKKMKNNDSANIAIDYFVATRRGHIVSDDKWDWIEKNIKLDEKPVWELLIDNRPRNFIKVFKNNGNKLN